MGDLERDTRLEPVGDGAWRGQLSRAWEDHGGAPSRGYLAALALRAAGRVASQPRPVSISCQFHDRPRFGAVDALLFPLARERTAALRVSLTQSEAPILEASVWAAAEELPGYAVDFAPIPEHPGPEGLPSVSEAARDRGIPLPACWQHFEFRSRWREPGEEGAPREPVARSWHRFQPSATYEDRFLDAARIVLLAELSAFSPLLFVTGDCGSSVPWFGRPLELNVRFHRDTRKAGWVMVEGRVPAASGGVIGSELSFWSVDGLLVASASCSMECRANPLAPDLAAART